MIDLHGKTTPGNIRRKTKQDEPVDWMNEPAYF